MRQALAALIVALIIAVPAPATGWLWTSRHQPLVLLDSINWGHDRSVLVQSNPGHAFLALPRLKHGEQLLAVQVIWQGGSGHTADPIWQGITTPTLEVWHRDAYGYEEKLCWAQDDDEVSPAAYEQPHAITAYDCGTVNLAGGDVFVRFSSEFTSWLAQQPDYQPGGVIWSLKTLTSG